MPAESARRRPIAAVAVLLTLTIAACGAVASSPGSGRPGTAASPSTVLTEADSGRTVPLALGESASLRLSNRYTWSTPQVEGAAVRIGPAGTGAWTITAAGTGTAIIRSGGRLACPAGTVCPALVVAFTLTVVVS